MKTVLLVVSHIITVAVLLAMVVRIFRIMGWLSIAATVVCVIIIWTGQHVVLYWIERNA